MTQPTRRALAALATLAPAAALAQPTADVFAAGAVKTAVEALLEGQPWTARFGTVGALRDLVLAGARPRVVLLSDDAIARLGAASLVVPGTIRAIGRTGVALTTRAGAPLPDISTPEALRAALLATPSFAYADPARGATAGAHVGRLLDRLGIADAMRAKTRLVPFGVEGVTMAANGEVALAASQATEIIGRPGVALVGFLPDAVQLWTPYSAALIDGSQSDARPLDLFTTPRARAAFAAIGFVPA